MVRYYAFFYKLIRAEKSENIKFRKNHFASVIFKEHLEEISKTKKLTITTPIFKITVINKIIEKQKKIIQKF